MASRLPVALLDACVLAPMPLADTLLRCAQHRLFLPLWSDPILAEVERVLLRDFKRTPEQATRRIAAMRAAFPQARAEDAAPDFQLLIPRLPIHTKDRHVLAVAIAGRADWLVTADLAHFGGDIGPWRVAVIHPDDFLCDVLLRRRSPALLLRILQEQVAAIRVGGGPPSVENLLGGLERGNQCRRFAAALRAEREKML